MKQVLALLGAFALLPAVCLAHGVPPSAEALATIDLATSSGAKTASAVWRYHDVAIRPTEFWASDAEGQPSDKAVSTYAIEPQAGSRSFDDSAWPTLAPGELARRRTGGRLSFAWYRLHLRVPRQIESIDIEGTTAVLEISVDDYAEIWVDGELGRGFGQQGGSVIAGWNAPNRIVLQRGVRPGQEIVVAIFGINGPISQSPTNYVYLRRAALEFHRGSSGPQALSPHEVNVTVERRDPGIDRLLSRNPKLFKLADGFTFTEGPVWREGNLFFSDPNENRIYRLNTEGVVTVHRERSGYGEADVARYRQPGSNGLAFDRQGRLTACEHGNRRITRTERDGSLTVIADRFEGKRLNSPNDLVYARDGALYFTDPPFGLPGMFEDPEKELDFSGVYRWQGGELQLLTKEFTGPNGIALSPDEKFLYIANWDVERRVLVQFPLNKDGSLGKGRVLLDLTDQGGDQALDGVKVDREGNLYVTGPGGLWVVTEAGEVLGRIEAPSPIHNLAWGGKDRRALYLAAQERLYRLPVLIPGPRK